MVAKYTVDNRLLSIDKYVLYYIFRQKPSRTNDNNVCVKRLLYDV